MSINKKLPTQKGAAGVPNDKKELSKEFQNCLHRLETGGFGDLRVAVVGDLMLDRYIYGSVKRISPEAPVPILDFEKETFLLGGAGNVARNLCDLGVNASLDSVVGNDEAGRRLLALSEMQKISSDGVFQIEGRVTTQKTRTMSGTHQQMLRLDYERKEPLSEEAQSKLLQKLASLLENGLNGVVLSDYGKGVCSPSLCKEIISLCAQKNVRVFIDPKGAEWERYAGAFMITPNLKELSDASHETVHNNDAEIVAAAQKLLVQTDVENILVTRSEQGATLVAKDGTVFHQPCEQKEVFDVSGAGDTMISTITAFILCGVPLEESVFAANTAAQAVIQKAGTASVSACELASEIERELGARDESPSAQQGKKLMARDAAALQVRQWKEAGERVIFTNGCFDVLHVGHVDSLNKARALGDRLVVGLNSDASVKRLKGASRPVNSEADRAKMLAALESVDAVVLFEEDTPRELLSHLRPNVAAKGGDYRPEQVAGGEFADEVVILPLTRGYSTTRTIEALKNGGGCGC
jgi:D-beta-D-heptose 7-phosphate kinase/D-beta-D-heptose 1-phosphate adenosyltransferase